MKSDGTSLSREKLLKKFEISKSGSYYPVDRNNKINYNYKV